MTAMRKIYNDDFDQGWNRLGNCLRDEIVELKTSF